MADPASIKEVRQRGAFPLAFVVCLAGIFFFSYFNRFAGLRSGDGELSGGLALLDGRLPYRDYYTAGPPLNQIKSAVELGLFGKTLLVSRLFAVLERLGIAALLFFWLRKVFSPWAASIAALATILLSAGDHTDPLASYNHDAILLAMLSGFFVSLSVESKTARRMLLCGLAAGSAAGLSSLTKQTIGLGEGTALLVLGVMATARLRDVVSGMWWGLCYLGGLLLPVAAVAGYLYRLGVLRTGLVMLFVSGPSAKASVPFAFVHRELSVAADNPAWVVPALIAAVLCVRPVYRAVVGGAAKTWQGSPLWPWFWGVALLGVAELLVYTAIPAVRDTSKCAVYFTLVTTSLLGCLALVRGLQRCHCSVRLWHVAIMTGTGWAVAVTLSLSWPAFEAMLLPGLGVMVAAVIDGASGWGRRFVFVTIAAMMFLSVREKLDLPFGFDHQDEPSVRVASIASNQPMLRGMRLPVETIRLLDETSAWMREKSLEGKTVFTYPEMSLAYTLSGGRPPTFSGSHNIDVLSDSMARDEAQRLLQNRPAVVLYARPSEAELREQELIWRGGRRSGQRDLVAAVDLIVADYRLVDTFEIRPGNTPIELYVEREK
jgi:hypothetical protein